MAEKLQGEKWILSRDKRVFDVTGATAALPLFMAASVLGASAFYAESGVNPLMYQRRLGRGNRSMRMLKLRSMPGKPDYSDGSNGHADERASDVGKVIRKYKIDEMLQVIHVLTGKMSIVGPRPLVKVDVENTMDLLSPPEQKDWLRARTIAKPGWVNEFGDLAGLYVPQSSEFLLARVERDCNYLSVASYERDLAVIQSRFGTVAAMFKHDVADHTPGE